ncbi:MAG: hypothetical protein AAGA75_18370 [Cyanobacteria bacterium P01_E01_bin.6]
MYNQKLHFPLRKNLGLMVLAAGSLTTLISMFAIFPGSSIATEQNDNPRGDFPGRLEGGGSRNTENPFQRCPLDTTYWDMTQT